jgi:predicted nuclease with TOPRIM domain
MYSKITALLLLTNAEILDKILEFNDAISVGDTPSNIAEERERLIENLEGKEVTMEMLEDNLNEVEDLEAYLSGGMDAVNELYTNIKSITEEQFEAMFTPQINHIERGLADASIEDEDICSFSGTMYETFGADLEYVLEMNKQKRVVTIIEGDQDTIGDDGEEHATIYYASGYHLVNRLGFLVLDKPYTYEFEVRLDW